MVCALRLKYPAGTLGQNAQASVDAASSQKDRAVYYSAHFQRSDGNIICNRGYTSQSLMEATLGPESVRKVLLNSEIYVKAFYLVETVRL